MHVTHSGGRAVETLYILRSATPSQYCRKTHAFKRFRPKP